MVILEQGKINLIILKMTCSQDERRKPGLQTKNPVASAEATTIVRMRGNKDAKPDAKRKGEMVGTYA